ncbi:hypothetical protein [Crocinitomix catalasitica]|uniref:hypothetical protein n=1 Tax=Crocinitomix catalasitica TaxID=184607 RepID=UPI00048561A6|nr:hypothetical protein [Crocinitomix catalasitica]
MSKKLAVILGLILSLQSFGQSTVKVRVIPGKLQSKTQILKPIENDQWVYEEYSYFKQVYWLIDQDTLTEQSEGYFKSPDLSINTNESFQSMDPCDSLVNDLLNSALSHQTASALDKKARLLIGDKNSKYQQHQQDNRPTVVDEYQNCHEDFQLLNNKWYEEQIALIESIKIEKENRYATINATTNIANEFMANFLSEFDRCEIDYNAFALLASNHTETFLTAIHRMSEDDFFDLQLKLKRLPESIQTDKAIAALKSAEIKSNRKKKIIRELK